jgi:hypothetical protein
LRYLPVSTIIKIVASLVLAFPTVYAQQVKFQDVLLDRLIGNWVLQGTIDGRETTHDIVAEWVLDHEYIRLHEVSREKDTRGQAAYEAIVFIGWDEPSSQYLCLWLDSTGGGGLSDPTIGRAKRSGDEIAFLFKTKGGSVFHTTFAYSRSSDAWQWLMDGEEGGKLEPFARVRLTRK